MEWSCEQTLQFLKAYRGEVVLWDLTHNQRKDKRKINDAWCRLSEELKFSIAELKKKKESLMATFRGLLRRKKASIRSGAGVGDVYKPVWFAYDYMEEFLAPVYEITRNVKTEDPVRPAEGETPADTVEEGTMAASAEMTVEPSQNTQDETQRPVSTIKQINSRQTIRRRKIPPKLQKARNKMGDAFNMLQNVCSNKSKEREEDECDLFGKIVAKKLRRLPEEERELLMYEIDGIFINRRQNRPQLLQTTPLPIESRPSAVSGS